MFHWLLVVPQVLKSVVPVAESLSNQCSQLAYFIGKFLKFCHFVDVVSINIFGLVYLENLAYFGTTNFFTYATCWTKFASIFPTLLRLETPMQLPCALFSQKLVFPRMFSHVARVETKLRNKLNMSWLYFYCETF